MKVADVVSVLLTLVLTSAGVAGEEWAFGTPPSAEHRVSVEADWRGYGKLELPVQLSAGDTNKMLLCSFFFQTKQDLWLQCRQPLLLDGSEQRFKLDLGRLSPDWSVSNSRRPFDLDVLRWVRTWGVKIFCPDETTGVVSIGELQLIPRGRSKPVIRDIEVPASLSAGVVNRIRFRIGDLNTNPFDKQQVSGGMRWKMSGAQGIVPVYFRQNYTRVVHPGTGDEMLEQLERPVWEANWVPDLAGEYELKLDLRIAKRRLRRNLGHHLVVEKAALVGSEKPVAKVKEFIAAGDGSELVQFVGGKWDYLPRRSRIREYWVAPIDWTSSWGHYFGLGEFDQATAWRFEQALQRHTGPAMPILLFGEDELDNTGKFNWIDHPLNKVNGGNLDRPSDIFLDEEARKLVVDRARYLWSRYGNDDSVSSLAILVDRIEQPVLNWIDSVATEIVADLPGVSVVCNNPDTMARSRSVALDLFDSWETDGRLSLRTAMTIDAAQKAVEVTATRTDTAAIVSRGVKHWQGASAFTCDIHCSGSPDYTVKVMCTLRVDARTVYESKLVPLRDGEWTRVMFDIGEMSAWKCPDEKERKLQPRDLMNLREVGLRFFGKERGAFAAKVTDTVLHWPYSADVERRAAFAITDVKPNAASIPCYEKYELSFKLNRIFNNPYDPSEIDVMIELTAPDGGKVSHPGYYHEPWKIRKGRVREEAVRDGGPVWRVRCAPMVEGKHAWTLTAKNGSDTARASGSFVVTRARTPGFVVISKKDPKYFEFSNGSFYYPIGHNIRSPSDIRPSIYHGESLENARWADTQGVAAYEKWFGIMHENGENFSRVWMAPWWCGLEWNEGYEGYHGVGYFNQANAARLDMVLELAEKEGIYINLETMNHGALSTHIDADWRHNPMNKSTQPGGFIMHASDFVHSDRAKESHLMKLRYVVARWGYSRAIAWWGVMTEAEWTEPYYRSLKRWKEKDIPNVDWIPKPYASSAHKEPFADWLSKTAGYMRDLDAHPHPVSVHFSNPEHGIEVWSLPNIDIVHNNAYTEFVSWWSSGHLKGTDAVADVMLAFGYVYNRYSKKKPLMIGEWGGSPLKNDLTHLTAELHTGIWAMSMTRVAGVGGYWWWNLIDARSLYPNFKALASYMKGEDRRGRGYRSAYAKLTFPPLVKPDIKGERHGLVLFNKNELFGYIYNRAINLRRKSIVPTGFADPSFPESGAGTLTLPEVVRNGKYRIEYWDTYSGKMIQTVEVTVTDAKRKIPIRSHRVDLALKLKPVK